MVVGQVRRREVQPKKRGNFPLCREEGSAEAPVNALGWLVGS